MPLTPATVQELSRFAIEGVAFDALPPDVIAIAKEVIVNAAAVGLAGAAQQEGHALTQFAQEMGGNGKCTIIGKGLRTSPVYAALVNGMLIHLLDFDDEVVANGSHPGSVVFPVVMALGEMNGISGQEVLTAFVAGCEVISRLRTDGITDVDSANVCGATIAAGMLLGLDATQSERAIVLAGVGLLHSARPELVQGQDGSPTLPRKENPLVPGDKHTAGPGRAYRQGQAAMRGVMAAMLSQQGLAPAGGDTAQPSPSCDNEPEARFAASLGKPYHFIQPGVSLKLYPCASPSHTAIDAALQLVQQYRTQADDITEVSVGVTPDALEALPYPTPASGWEARACLSFIVASALTYGHPLIDNFTDTAIVDPRVRELMDQITVTATEVSCGSIAYPASIRATLRDGRRLQHRAEFARGQVELPLSPEELDAKFLYCSRYILPPDHIEESITRLRDLENIENTTGIFSVLGG